MVPHSEMAPRLSTKIARRFLFRVAGQMLSTNGTVQIGNRAAKYVIKGMSGSLEECKFSVQLDLLGHLFLLRGSIVGNKVAWGSILQKDSSGRMSEADPKSAAKIFGADPELWIKRSIKDAMVRSVGSEANLGQMVVVDGEIVDSSSIPTGPAAQKPASAPMSKAV